MKPAENNIWKRVAAAVVVVGVLLAIGNATPIVGVDGRSFEAVRNCEQPLMWMMPIYSCHAWPTVLSDPLSIALAPALLPLVLLTYAAFWLRSRITGK